ncbi:MULTISPECIES: glycosyltransferase family 2 protein [Chryseobacterium]|uniref:Glycosyltransferase involved in cell wall biosynthesis n=1 Tax=Chryseobacterium camelliae TaxID=1265445 RepID=A0ABU0TDH3_9FLAO|nr:MULTISPECIES: glycosyltransferase [Chryseobacterium]MDT3407089.1 glycosyltransferase involved in cell wall biosynthesis [Pseudacidovorax intermedius]MDQ1095119.1 glycosyltransferase involved in cell wall biosynthesis [Chryseobacterium camelliae]MDQ1099057.1 glycosyltransferase involved in cell wall biosynthesis [Chryseobacterium sp. SORGH_AS_1048]MDR6086406.1 glycosyltransferase involved in cell wall biosynthesis [Chryseobacterium sp. SORGH_AS_0909]MDR6130778.1 glycosyltransferase involved 
MEYPLVSIVVITYNSLEFILDTLNSIKEQTYKNLELIITDDGSKDATVEYCRTWLDVNKEAFVSSKIITTDKNTGIPANCNRGVNAAGGEWIKIIAGDDLLTSDCVENFIRFIAANNSAQVIYSKALGFQGNIIDKNYIEHSFAGYNKFFSSDTSKQYKMLLRRNYGHGPTIFFKKSIWKAVGGFDEKFKFEDHPFALKVSKNKIRLYYTDVITVYYRENIASITRSDDKRIFSNFYCEIEKFNKAEVYPNCSLIIKILKKTEFYKLHYFDKWGLNRRTKINKLLFLATYYLNPLNLYNKYF